MSCLEGACFLCMCTTRQQQLGYPVASQCGLRCNTSENSHSSPLLGWSQRVLDYASIWGRVSSRVNDFSDVFGLSLWRFHRECPRTHVITGKETRKKKRKPEPRPRNKSQKANVCRRTQIQALAEKSRSAQSPKRSAENRLPPSKAGSR